MSERQPIHQVQCDDCKRWPINGWRYRCGQCPASLCGACIVHTQHNPAHCFVLLKRQMDASHEATPQLLAALYEPVKRTPTFPAPTTATTSTNDKKPRNAPFAFASPPPTLDNAKGPLFDKASELARPPNTHPLFESLFAEQEAPTYSWNESGRAVRPASGNDGEQMTMDGDKRPAFQFPARSDSTAPVMFGRDSPSPTGRVRSLICE